MNVAQKIIAIMGAFYVLIGGAISIVFLFAFWGGTGRSWISCHSHAVCHTGNGLYHWRSDSGI